ncbi:MAG: hypothetical protein ACRCYE_06305 [Sarcina sp.]
MDKKEWKTPEVKDLSIKETNYSIQNEGEIDGWWIDKPTMTEKPFYS